MDVNEGSDSELGIENGRSNMSWSSIEQILGVRQGSRNSGVEEMESVEHDGKRGENLESESEGGVSENGESRRKREERRSKKVEAERRIGYSNREDDNHNNSNNKDPSHDMDHYVDRTNN